jgi:hypothetical protein
MAVDRLILGRWYASVRTHPLIVSSTFVESLADVEYRVNADGHRQQMVHGTADQVLCDVDNRYIRSDDDLPRIGHLSWMVDP